MGMWVEFEWENKVPVNTDIGDLNAYIEHIAAITNMQLLTPLNPRHDDSAQSVCQFLAANLHAKSIFGEHALMNVSIEQKQRAKDGEELSGEKMRVSGHIRIRCKSQGIALSLGEKNYQWTALSFSISSYFHTLLESSPGRCHSFLWRTPEK